MKSEKKGITLIALVVTIIVLLILAGVALTLIFGDNGILSQATEAKFKTKMGVYRDEVNLWVAGKYTDGTGRDYSKLNSGNPLKDYIDMVGEENSDVKKSEVTYNIEDIIKDISREDKEKVVVYKGEMYYVKRDTNKNAEQEAKWCTDINIKILELKRPSGIVIKNGNYEFVNGVYVCTPYLTDGFNKLRTRYVNEENGYMTPGTFIFNNPEEDWYSYGESKWANIVVEDGGSETYFTWIPRYCYKIDAEGQKTDVKLISAGDERTPLNAYQDPYEEYFDEYGERIKDAIPWTELEKQGYVIPEAFTFGEKELAGIWVMKYILGESLTAADGGSVLSYNMTTVKGGIALRDIKINNNAEAVKATPITKYTVSLNGYTKYIVENGKIIDLVNNKTTTMTGNITEQSFTFAKSTLSLENNVLNITALNANGEMVGSYTDTYTPEQYNEPLLDAGIEGTGFNKDLTFYVTYDDSENETSYIPISQKAPEDWYDYESSNWANIVVRNNGGETYYTWIPRYKYRIDASQSKTTIKFIKGTTGTSGTAVEESYVIPEAFKFGGTELEGFWVMKYMLGNTTAAILDTNVVAGATNIKARGITGSSVGSGKQFNYFIDGQLKASKTNPTEEVNITGLESGKTYTLVIEVRDKVADVKDADRGALVGTIVKQVKTIEMNAPDLEGFAAEVSKNGQSTSKDGKTYTYYVEYDESGANIVNETTKIAYDTTTNKWNMPNGWYDYSNSRWANILVTDGTVENGKITGETWKTYYTWIPRYKYKIDSDNAKTTIEFIKGTDGTSGTTTDTWTIPEAFKFGDTELKGIWVMKYMLGDTK